MNKKFIIAGVMFWASLSGYMGLRVLESYTEDAVYAVLSVIPAQAQEIRYSFLTNALTVKGIEYEIPHDTIVHRGTIESVEVKNFARKIMFVKPNMPPYDADELPRVGESFTFTGIIDNVHAGQTVTERRIGSLDVKGWYQRIGMLLDRYHRDGMTAPFFEELYRVRVDEINASQFSYTMKRPDMKVPLSLSIDQVSVPGGIKAPRGTAKNTPMNLVFDRVLAHQGGTSASMGRIEARDVLFPEPAMMERLVALGQNGKAKQANASEDVMNVLDETYAVQAPFSFASVQNVRLATENLKEDVTLSSASYALSYHNDGTTNSFRVSDLHIKPEAFGEMERTIRDFAPEGLKLSFSSEGKSDSTSFQTDMNSEFSGLGKLVSKIALEGDFNQLKKLSLHSDLSKHDSLMALSSFKVKNLEASYADSGLLPLVIAVAAQRMQENPQAIAGELSRIANGLAADPNPLVSQLGRAFTEQMQTPGELSVALSPERPIRMQEMLMMLLTEPEAIPLKVESRAGSKTMKEYLLTK